MISYEDYVALRNMKKMKNSDVAKAAGIPASTFSDWKKGKSKPKEAKLMKIASALGVTYAYMMGWESDVDLATAALENVIRVNDENGGSAKLANMLYNDTVKKPAGIDITDEEIGLIEKFRKADASTKDVIVRLLSYASYLENRNHEN